MIVAKLVAAFLLGVLLVRGLVALLVVLLIKEGP